MRRAVSQHLRHEVYVRDECGIQHDRHIARVEKFNRIAGLLPSGAHHLDRNVDFPTLDEAAGTKDENRRQQVGDIGQILPIQSKFQSGDLIFAREQEMEQGEESSCGRIRKEQKICWQSVSTRRRIVQALLISNRSRQIYPKDQPERYNRRFRPIPIYLQVHVLTLHLGTSSCGDRHGRESRPHNGFANMDSNEKIEARSEAILLNILVEHE